MTARHHVRTAAVAAAVLLAAACGSTVQGSSNDLARPEGLAGSALEDPSLGAPSGEAGSSGTNGSAGSDSLAGSEGFLPSGVGRGEPTGGTTGGSAGGGSTTGGSGGGPSGGSSLSAGAPVPGTTATTIKVGFPYADSEDSNDFMSAIGASGIAVGDSRAQFNALVEEVNAAGGILGRKVVPVFHKLDSGASNEANQQAMCEHFANDDRVFAVMLGLGATLRACLHKAGIPHISGRLSVAGDADYRSAPMYIEPVAIGLDTIGRTYPQQLASAGFLSKATGEAEVRLGVVYFEEPAFANAYKNHLKPGFAAVGSPVKADAGVPGNNLAALNAAVQNAVLRFQTEGINRVTFLDYDAFTVGFFMVSAEQQGYKPTYAINSQNAPSNLAAQSQVVSKHQLQGTYLIGWRPLYDTSTDDPLVPGGQAACLNAVRKRNVAMPSRNAQGSVATFCDSVFFLRAALARAGRISASAFLAGTNALGDSYVASSTYRAFLSPNNHDGVAQIRSGRFFDECTCFRYTSGPRSLR